MVRSSKTKFFATISIGRLDDLSVDHQPRLNLHAHAFHQFCANHVQTYWPIAKSEWDKR
jgi:hypothetical protein